VNYIHHLRIRDEDDMCDISFDIVAESISQAIKKAKEAILESLDEDGFIHIPLTGGATNGKIAIDPNLIDRHHVISFTKIEDDGKW
jgi:hypothetical protein